MKKENIPFDKSDKYELLFYKFTWVSMLISFLYVVLIVFCREHNVYQIQQKVNPNMTFNIAVFVIAIILHCIKYFYGIKKGLLKKPKIYFLNRIMGLVLISFIIVYVGIGQWAFIVILFSIMVSSLTKGVKTGLILVGSSFGIHVFLLLSTRYFLPLKQSDFLGYDIYHGLLLLLFLYIMFVLFAIFCDQ